MCVFLFLIELTTSKVDLKRDESYEQQANAKAPKE